MNVIRKKLVVSGLSFVVGTILVVTGVRRSKVKKREEKVGFISGGFAKRNIDNSLKNQVL